MVHASHLAHCDAHRRHGGLYSRDFASLLNAGRLPVRCSENRNAARMGGVSVETLDTAYKVDSISKPQASSSASGMYFELRLRRAHSRKRVERMY